MSIDKLSIGSSASIALSFDEGRTFVEPNALLIESSISMGYFDSPAEIDLRFLAPNLSVFMGQSNIKIRNKKVDDCTIQELLYAVRQKVKVVK